MGIGAFPLLPGQTNPWLTSFLRTQLCPDEASATAPAPDAQLAQRSARITTAGLRVRRDADLVFVAHLGSAKGRTPGYVAAFHEGTARWFHVYDLALARGKLTPAKVADITRCAVAVYDPAEGASVLRHVYDVRSVRFVDRSEITEAQSGTSSPSREGRCWLFELGAAVALERPVPYQREAQYTARVTSFESLQRARTWRDLDDRY